MASLRQILGATAVDIRNRLTGGGPPNSVPAATTTGYAPATGSPHSSPPPRNWFPPPSPFPGGNGDPYGPPVRQPPGPHYSPPPYRIDTAHFDAVQNFILSAHQNATNVLTHGSGYQISGTDHHLTKASATDTGTITATPSTTPSPTHPPYGAPHWLGPPLRPPLPHPSSPGS